MATTVGVQKIASGLFNVVQGVILLSTDEILSNPYATLMSSTIYSQVLTGLGITSGSHDLSQLSFLEVKSPFTGQTAYEFGVRYVQKGTIDSLARQFQGPPGFIGPKGPAGITAVTATGGFTAGGDLSGTSTNQTVVGIQGNAALSCTPGIGQVLTWAVGGGEVISTGWTAQDPTGGGFTADGDLTGTSIEQTVASINRIPSPDSALAGRGLIVAPQDKGSGLYSPRSLVSDGTYLYAAESTTVSDTSNSLAGSGLVVKMLPMNGGPALSVVKRVDLRTVLPTIDRVRDLAVDSTYIYAACWTSENVAIIDKATMTIAGWGWLGAGQQATSVCADGAGNFYCYGNGTPKGIAKFSTVACLGQPPSTITRVASYNARGRFIRYGGGYIWFTQGGMFDGTGTQKVDPGTMTLVVADGTTAALSSCLAFGDLWISDGTQVQRLSTVDLSSLAAVTLPNASATSEIALGPDSAGTLNTRLYVTDEDSAFVWVIDPNTNTVEATFTPGEFHSEGAAAIGNIAYIGGFLPGIQGSRTGIYYVNYPDGGSGLVGYVTEQAYGSVPKRVASSGRLDLLEGLQGQYKPGVGYVPIVGAERGQSRVVCGHMLLDRTYNPSAQKWEGPYAWMCREGVSDILVHDLDTDSSHYSIPLRTGLGADSRPHTLLMTPNYVWVLTNLPNLVKIDRNTWDVLEYGIPIPSPDFRYGGQGLAWDPVGNRVLTTLEHDSGIVIEIDAETNQVKRHDLVLGEEGRGIIVVGSAAFFFGTANVFKFDLASWSSSTSLPIPSATSNRVRAICEKGIIFFVSERGTNLCRFDPTTFSIIDSITIQGPTYDLCYEADTPTIMVTMDYVGIQNITVPFGTMALGDFWSQNAVLRGVLFDPSWDYIYWIAQDETGEATWCSTYPGAGSYVVNNFEDYRPGNLDWMNFGSPKGDMSVDQRNYAPVPVLRSIKGMPVADMTNAAVGKVLTVVHDIPTAPKGVDYDSSHGKLIITDSSSSILYLYSGETSVHKVDMSYPALFGLVTKGGRVTHDETHIVIANDSDSMITLVRKSSFDGQYYTLAGYGSCGRYVTNGNVLGVAISGDKIYAVSSGTTEAFNSSVRRFAKSDLLRCWGDYKSQMNAEATTTNPGPGTEMVDCCIGGGFLWVAGGTSKKIFKINLGTLAIVSTYTHASETISGLVYASDGSGGWHLWACTGVGGNALKFDISTFPAPGSLLATVALPGCANAANIVGGGGYVHVSDAGGTGKVYLVDARFLTVTPSSCGPGLVLAGLAYKSTPLVWTAINSGGTAGLTKSWSSYVGTFLGTLKLDYV